MIKCLKSSNHKYAHTQLHPFYSNSSKITYNHKIPCYLLLQYLSLPDDGKLPIALSAIPTETRQGEEQPTSTVSPLNVLPEV